MDQTSAHTDKAKTALILGVVFSVAVSALPQPYYGWVAWPLMLLSTLFHEMGHGIAALLGGGSFHKFVMYADGSGVATTSGSGGALASAFTAAGGLVGPAVVAGLLFWLGRRQKGGTIGLGILAAVSALALLLVVRNGFGLVFVGAFAAICAAFAFFTAPSTARVALLFLGVQLALSVFSRGDYLFMQYAHTGSGVMDSDTQNMADALLLPYWFWGLACGAFSILVLFLGLRPFFKKDASFSQGRI